MARKTAQEAVLAGVTPIIQRARREQSRSGGSLEQALLCYRVALAALAVIAGDTKPVNDRCWSTIAQVHFELAELLSHTSQLTTAAEHYEVSRQISEAAEGSHSLLHARRCADLAHCYALLDQLCPAASMARKSLSAACELGNDADGVRLEAFRILHSVERQQGHEQAARIAWKHCLELSARVIGVDLNQFAVPAA